MTKLAQISKTPDTPVQIINSYMLRHKNAIRLNGVMSRGEAIPEQVITLFSDYGRAMSAPLLARVCEMSSKERGRFFESAGQSLHAAFGTHFKNSPMYRAFPHHTEEMLDYELVQFFLEHNVSAVFDHRLHGANPVTGVQEGLFGPDEVHDNNITAYVDEDTPVRFGERTYDIVKEATDEMIGKTAQTVLSTLLPFTPDEAQFIAACVDEGFIAPDDLSRVRFREKLPALSGLVSDDVYAQSAISVTDALRLAVHYSDGDVSLSKPTRFNLTTSMGKRVFRLAEAVINSGKGSPEQDVLSRQEVWKRLLRHVGKARAKVVAPYTCSIIDDVRAGKVRSFNHDVQYADPLTAAGLLLNRPGTFVRQAIGLSRRFNSAGEDRAYLLEAAKEAFSVAPVMPMLQLHTVLDRTSSRSERFHILKNGKMMRSERSPENHDDLKAVLEAALSSRLAGLLPWSGAEGAEDKFVPVGGRTASVSSNGSVRGDSQILPASDGQRFARLFLHWKDQSDVDLSAVFLDREGVVITDCTFYNLKARSHDRNTVFAVHSGDIRDGNLGAAEYIDIDIAKAKAVGVKSALAVVNVYSGKPFSSFPSHVGVQLRDGVSGKHFEESAVESAMRLSSESTMNTCAMLDLDEMRLIYIDMPGNWAQRTNVTTGASSLKQHVDFLTNYSAYRTSMATVLRFAGTEGGPVLTEKDLVEKRAEIMASLAQGAPKVEEDLDLGV